MKKKLISEKEIHRYILFFMATNNIIIQLSTNEIDNRI